MEAMAQSLTARQMAAAAEEGDNARAETGSPSSSEPDFYADAPADADPDPARPDVQQEEKEQHQQQKNSSPSLPDPLGEPADEDDTQDSSSDMDVSESSRSSSPESDQERVQEQERDQHQVQTQAQAQAQVRSQDSNHVTPTLTGTKRKLSDAAEDDNLDALEQALHEDPSKKRRHSPSRPSPVAAATDTPALVASLPPELWQHIFLRLSPAMLSRCLRVCRAFNTYLTKIKAQPTLSTAKKPKDPEKDKVKTVDSDSIWAEARKVYFPNMPRPLMRCNELTMLQLIGGKTCQFCGKTPAPLPATGPFSAGPGPHGLRVVWPFGIRTCGQCFDQHTLKDVELLVSPAASLRFGLPYAFRTPDLHFVPEMTRQLPGGIPSHLRVAKVHYQADVQTIQEEYEDVKGYGEGTAEEWRKGLVTKGKEAMADAARWEKWESQIRLGADLPHALREYDLASFPKYVEETQGKSAAPNDDVSGAPLRSLATTKGGLASLPQPVHAFQNGYGTPLQPAHSSHFPPPLPHMPRPLRKNHEVDEDRLARKADIERRCMELEPPLEPRVLQHIEPFQAAMQITTPMDDAQWELLRPRILAEREAAELVEHQKATQLAALQAAIPTAGDNDILASMRPAKEVYDKEYENIQDPLRKRLAEYADGLIQSSWNGGEGLNRDTVTSLAIQIVLHVRKRYLEEKRAGQLPDFSLGSKDASKGPKHGTSQAHPAPFLSLDNMKWVHDNKIRPYTDPHRKELFICAGCAADNSAVGKPKWFAFEGLIQHYGAKHTSAFSKGNIVVHWQTAEWPDEPPFLTNVAPNLKMERKAAEFRASHNHRKHGGHTKQERDRYPEGGRGGYGTGETNPGMLLSENPLFSAGVHAQTGPPGNGYPPYQGQHGTAHSAPSTQQTQHVPAHMSYDAQLTQLAADARDVWDALDGVNDLMEPVKMQTVVHHVVIRFQQRFYQRPSLDLLTDALATNPDMKPLKNTNGLACKFCVATQTDGSANYQSYYARIRNVKLYNTSSLITHFKIIHPQPAHSAAPGMDWTDSMIELPEVQLISDLIRAPGMDDEKISLIASAFPNAFPYSLPKIGIVQDALPAAKEEVGADAGLATRLLGRLNRKAPQQGKKKKGGGGHHQRQQQQWHSNGVEVSTREGSQETSDVAVGEDEYDPRRPSGTVAPGLDLNDPARFDTDLAKRKNENGSSLPQHPAVASQNSGAWNLAPETLAALNNLTALQQSQQQPSSASSHGPGPSDAPGSGLYAREQRSPSVGRAEPTSTTTGTAGTPTSGQQAQAPDISAILASLTGQSAQQQQQQVATSPVGGQPQQYISRPPTATTGKPLYEYGTPESGRRATSGRYASSAGAYGGSTEGQQHQYDLGDALARNQRGYDRNSQVPFSQQHHQQQIPRPSSPPRYRYEDEYPPPPHSTVASVPSSQYLPATQQLSSSSAPGPVQYIHLPSDPYAGVRASHTPTMTSYQGGYDSSYYPPPYQQHHDPPQPPKPIYIDEHGRQLELIPIDDHDENPAAAPGPPPAPVQYAPHPFEQQQQQQQEQYASGHGHGYTGYGAYYQPPPQPQQQNQQDAAFQYGYQSSYAPQPQLQPQQHYGQGGQYHFPPHYPAPQQQQQQQQGGQAQAQYAYPPFQPYGGVSYAQQHQQGIQQGVQQGVQPFPDSNLRPPSPFA